MPQVHKAYKDFKASQAHKETMVILESKVFQVPQDPKVFKVFKDLRMVLQVLKVELDLKVLQVPRAFKESKVLQVHRVYKANKDCLDLRSIRAQPDGLVGQVGLDPQVRLAIQAQRVRLETQAQPVLKAQQAQPVHKAQQVGLDHLMDLQDLKESLDRKGPSAHKVFKVLRV